MRENPYAQGKNRTSIWLVRLAILFIVVVVLGTAVWLLVSRLQTAFQSGGVIVGDGHPNLSSAERIYLQAYLAQHATDLQKANGPVDEVTFFTIASGETANTIAANLVAAGLIQDSELFLNYARYYGLDAQLEAGDFTFFDQATIPDLAVRLTNAVANDVALRFLEGWRLEEMANYLATTRPAQIDADLFLLMVRRETAVDFTSYSFTIPDGVTLEGYLFPDTYRIPTDADTAYLINEMLSNFDNRVTPEMRQGYAAQGLSLHEAVTLASIVEREAVVADERPFIARVFLNRLDINMKLQADPTTQYALGYQAATDSWWKTGLTFADLEVNSPYNSYVVIGLPPGPIASPGLSSLQAVAQPATSDNIFFVADCADGQEGRHLFSVTYEEHLANVARCP